MNFCVIKDTVKVVDGSKNDINTMIQNAIKAGFTESEVEILTEEEYLARKVLEPIVPHPPTIEDRVTNTEIDVVALEETIDTIFGGV